MSLVSVVIPAYNSAAYIRGSLDSVLSQTLQDFEVIVVDDGSKDNTKEVVAPYLADSRVRYHFQENRGLPGARNAGAKIAQSKYFAFLDADDFFAPTALETIRKKFEETNAAWCNVGLLKLDGEKKTVRHASMPAGDPLLAVLEDDFITRCPFFPRDQFFAIGMYDEEIRVREDWDINIRLIEADKPCVVIDEPLYLYSRTEGSITTGNRRRLLAFTEKLMRKHHKRLADAGNRKIARIYAVNMWHLARQYFYEIKDVREGLRCMRESLRYDMNVFRLFHPIIHRIDVALGRH
jgi:glycosyltransferase involved in cell wall biosynthesis